VNAALIVTALFNGAWQGAALCVLAYLALRTQRRLNATTMFAVWSVLLAITLALPVANYVFAARPYTIHVAAASRAAMPAARYDASSSKPRAVGPHTPLRSTAPEIQVAVPRPSFSEMAVATLTWVLNRAGFVLLLVGLVAGVRVAMLLRDLLGMFAARRAARRIELPLSVRGSIRRRYAFAASGELKSPCVLGFSPALIVIPEDLLQASERELLSVVLHEREHVRRYDDVQNVLHRLIDAIAFFCPGVRIALRELALYREQICDDAAVNGIGDAVSYAMTLTGMAQWAQGRGVPVPSLIFKRKQLLHRLEVLLDKAVNHSLRMNRRFAAASALAMVLAAAIVVRVQVPVIAQTIEPPPPVPKVAPVRVPAKPSVQTVRIKTAVAPVVPAKALTVRVHVAPVTPKLAVKAHVLAKVAPRMAARVAQVTKITPVAPLMMHLSVPSPHVGVRVMPIVRVAPLATRVAVVTHVAVATRYAVAPAAPGHSGDIMDALDAAGIHNLSVDDLIAIRDHGVSTSLIRAAISYFGRHLSPADLVSLADHGVSARYLDSLRSEGVTGIAPASVVMLMDRGVNGALISAANAYFRPAPSVADLIYLSDHGVGASYLESLRSAGVQGVPVADVVRLMDHGVDGSYIVKIRRWNPRVSINDIIRLHDSGF
jgi:beta-lactamase regulating signal transducer with metallopeptidase domain